MTKPLLLTSLCAFVASIAFFTLSIVVLASGGDRHWRGSGKGDDWSDMFVRSYVSGDGPTISRDLPWTSSSDLTVSVPANVHYIQGAAGTVRVTGQQGAVEHLVLDGGDLKFDSHVRNAGRLEITITAPDVREFTLAGSQRLEVDGYKQDKFTATVAGSGDIVVRGATEKVELSVAGSGDIDAGGLAATEAEVNIAGSGDITVAPTNKAEITIAGSGDVTLKTNPPKVESHIMGSGKIVQAAS